MSPMPVRCTFLIDGTEPCDEWAEDGDRCDAHPRRTRRPFDDELDDED